MKTTTAQDLLLELEEPVSRISCGITALRLMTSGLELEEDPYADGLYALWSYLQAAEEALHAALSAAL